VPEHQFSRAKILDALQALGDELGHQDMYPSKEPPAKTRFFLEELLASGREGDRVDRS
jgi:hypothetical protein